MTTSPLPEQENLSIAVSDTGRYAWVPIPVFLVLIGTLWRAEMTVVWEPAFLLTTMNFVFSTAVSIFVSYLAALSFSRNASFTVLMLGCGTLFFGIVSLIAAVAVHFGQINIALTVHNTGVCLSGACHFMAAASTRQIDRRIQRHAILVLAIAYAIVLAVTGFLTFAAFEGVTPVFFIQGRGATPLRQAVLGSAVALFAFSGVIIRYFLNGFHRQFARWYALSLGLIATGLFGVLIITNVGSFLGWAGRAAQYLGGIYMLVAVFVAVRRSGEWDAALQVALKESQERYRTLTEATFEGIVISEDDVIVDVNDQFCRMLGFAESEIIGKRVDELIPVASADPQPSMNGEPSGRVAAAEVTIAKKDGEPVILETRDRFAARNGSRIRYSAIRDITAQKSSEAALRKNEAALRESLERYELVLSGAGAAIWDWDVARHEVLYSSRWKQLRGFADQEIGQSYEEWSRRIHPDDRQRVLTSLEAHLAGHTPFFAEEYRARRKDDSWMWVTDRGLAKRDDNGRAVRMVGSENDITERKQAEMALRRLNETLEQRVAERTAVAETRALQLQQLALELTDTEDRERRQIALILHDDLQQCLAALRYHLQMLIPSNADLDLDAVRKQIFKLEGLIDESMQKCRSLSHELSPPVLHESGLSAALAWLARDMKAKHGFRVDLDVQPEAEPVSPALASLLFRSVRELLFNAVKHSGGNSAAVSARSENNRISIRVSDNGRGCEPAVIQAQDGSMTGFGLFTIEERITFMGGRFEVDSAPGRGCRVTLEVPTRISIPDRRKQLEPEAVLSELGCGALLPTEKIRILLADDHAVLRQGLSNILEAQKDFEIVGQAVNGREAIRLAAELNPNVIMMDISMPEISGIEATAEIKKRHPHIRVIGLSMHDDVNTRAKMLQAGAVAYIYKASPAETLIEAIRSCLS